MQLEHRLSALLQLHLHSQLNTWVQWIGQQQLQDETTDIKVFGFGAAYIRDLTVCKHQDLHKMAISSRRHFQMHSLE